eukprot:3480571-Amphidinium_carterae.4
MFVETVALSEGIAALEFWMQWWAHAWKLNAHTMAIAKVRTIVPKAIDMRMQQKSIKGIVWTDNKGLHEKRERKNEQTKASTAGLNAQEQP